MAERPDVLSRVGVLLEALRGAARGTTPRGQVETLDSRGPAQTPDGVGTEGVIWRVDLGAP